MDLSAVAFQNSGQFHAFHLVVHVVGAQCGLLHLCAGAVRLAAQLLVFFSTSNFLASRRATLVALAWEPDVSLKKRKFGEPDINPGGASSLTADTPKRGESEQGSSAGNENLLAGCNAAANKLLCDTPSVDFSRYRKVLGR